MSHLDLTGVILQRVGWYFVHPHLPSLHLNADLDHFLIQNLDVEAVLPANNALVVNNGIQI